tara:strand:- start:60 stop:518 length:459 start_codon:yes stop_codon:yes gene_type:complete
MSESKTLDSIDIEHVAMYLKKVSNDDQETVRKAIIELYTKTRSVVKEFIDDGLIGGFNDIPMVTWYNIMSSMCAMVNRFDSVKDSEKLKEIVVYETVRLVLVHEIPVDDDVRKVILTVYRKIAPTIIDALIPGKRMNMVEFMVHKICCCPSM